MINSQIKGDILRDSSNNIINNANILSTTINKNDNNKEYINEKRNLLQIFSPFKHSENFVFIHLTNWFKSSLK